MRARTTTQEHYRRLARAGNRSHRHKRCQMKGGGRAFQEDRQDVQSSQGMCNIVNNSSSQYFCMAEVGVEDGGDC